ncbi:MAG: sensor histidine kinase [Pseudomonadota bacterium]
MMNSIRTRLLIWLLVPLSAVAAIVSLETFAAAQRVSTQLHDRTLLAAMLTLSENIVASSGTLLADNTLEMLTDNLGDEFFYYVRGPQGAFVPGYSGYPPIPDNMALEDETPIFYDGVYNGLPVRVTALRQFLSGGQINGMTTIITWQEMTTRSAFTISLFTRSLLRLVLLVLAAGAIVWFAVSRGLRPMRELESAIESRSPQDLNPIKRQMPVELTGIVGAMNSLFERVRRSKQNRERFIGNAAHQLRNPVAAIKVQAQAALVSGDPKELKSALQEIVDTSDKTGRMVNQMLSNASAHGLAPESMKSFDLASVVGEVTRNAAPTALEKNQDISLDVQRDPFVYVGHETLIREAIANLVDNAVRHNGAGTKIGVRLSRDGDQAPISIEVSDNGAALDEEHFNALSQPFATGTHKEVGSGLGLSLAKDVARSHGGSLAVHAAPGTAGKIIAMQLPDRQSTSA